MLTADPGACAPGVRPKACYNGQPTDEAATLSQVAPRLELPRAIRPPFGDTMRRVNPDSEAIGCHVMRPGHVAGEVWRVLR